MNNYDHISAIVNFFHDQDYTDWFCDKGRREANKTIKMAMGAGTEVDLAVQCLIKEGRVHRPVKYSAEVESASKAFLEWNDTYEPEITGMQRTISNEEQKITGTFDLELNHNEICDVKYATAIRPSYWIQLGGYRFLSGNTHRRLSVLRFDKTSDMYEYVVREDVEYLTQVFISTLNLYRFWQREKK